jgi:hypothetical protein
VSTGRPAIGGEATRASCSHAPHRAAAPPSDQARGVYRGLTPRLLGGAAEAAVLMGVYSTTLAALTSGEGAGGGGARRPLPEAWAVPLAGGVAGAAVSLVLGPSELIKARRGLWALATRDLGRGRASGRRGPAAARGGPANAPYRPSPRPARRAPRLSPPPQCRMQLVGTDPKHAYRGPMDVARRLVASRGLLGLTRGTGATAAREIPGNVIYFAACESPARARAAIVCCC